MRLKTIRRRLQTEGVSNTTLKRIHAKLFGIADADTLPHRPYYFTWCRAILGVKRSQQYFRGLTPKKASYDFTADAFLNHR